MKYSRSIIRLIRILIYSCLFITICVWLYLIVPRQYDVPAHDELENIQYWDLSSGSEIAYVRVGQPKTNDETPIIYLHGGPGGYISKSIITSLQHIAAKGYTIYAYDQIGSGSSDRLNDISEYTLTRHINDLGEIIDRIGSDQVILLGQSWGSVLATFFVVEHPERVEKIIMTSPGPVFPIDRNLAYVEAPDSLKIKIPQNSNRAVNAKVYTLRDHFIRWYAQVFGKKWASDHEVDHFYAHLNTELNKVAIHDTTLMRKSTAGLGYYSHLKTMKSLYQAEDPRSKMKDIDIPVLILKGQHDHIQWGYTQEYTELFGNMSLMVIPDAGHFIDLEQPVQYNQEISRFLDN